MITRYSIYLSLLLIIGCAHQTDNLNRSSQFSTVNDSEDLYISTNIKNSVDSIYVYYQSALNSLHFQDTLGAQIYFDKAFGVVSGFDEETKTVLMDWQQYDSLITEMSHRYEIVFDTDTLEQAAEEIRHELTQIEEIAFGDSLELPNEEIISDTGFNAMPLEINHRVELAMKYFQTKGRNVFTRWLERSGKYEDMVIATLRKYELPDDLLFLAMIESGFNPNAQSYARASGMWQFISATGRYYGLRNDWWFDERRDPQLATEAAAQHLKDLYDRFGHWYLALAGYNCNPKKVEARMRQYNTRDFWQLKRLPRQTRNYVPTYIAATIIAKNPKKYGFHVDKLEPVKFDTVMISESVDLNIVAKCVDTSFAAIKELNPAVRQWCTPPGVKNFTLNLPEGKREIFKSNYAGIPDDEKRSWVRHKIRTGETLSQIASKYSTTISVIKSYNSINGTWIRAGHYLVIPVPQNKNFYNEYRSYASSRSSTPKKARTVVVPKGHKKVVYSVKKGDTLGDIAENFNTRAGNIRSWNGLYYGQHIYPNQKLTLWVNDNSTAAGAGESYSRALTSVNPGEYYTVRNGDTLWDIANKYGISIGNLKKWNNKSTNNIRPGEKLRIRQVEGG